MDIRRGSPRPRLATNLLSKKTEVRASGCRSCGHQYVFVEILSFPWLFCILLLATKSRSNVNPQDTLSLDSCHRRIGHANCFSGGPGLRVEGDPQFPGEYAPRQERPRLTISSLFASEPSNGCAGLRGRLPLSPIHVVATASRQRSTWCGPLRAGMPRLPSLEAQSGSATSARRIVRS
jgi:hypothetical protein